MLPVLPDQLALLNNLRLVAILASIVNRPPAAATEREVLST